MPEGTALEVDQPNELHDTLPVEPVTFISLFASFSNQATEPVQIKRIEPVGLTDDVAVVSEIRIAERPSDALPNTLTPYGDFPMDPSVARSKDVALSSGYIQVRDTSLSRAAMLQ